MKYSSFCVLETFDLWRARKLAEMLREGKNVIFTLFISLAALWLLIHFRLTQFLFV